MKRHFLASIALFRGGPAGVVLAVNLPGIESESSAFHVAALAAVICVVMMSIGAILYLVTKVCIWWHHK